MKRALAWFARLVGSSALGRRLSRHRHPVEDVPEPTEAAAADDPAEELRRKLASAREPEPEVEVEVEPAPREETLEERRARVHAKAREAIDAMADDGGAS